MVAISDFKQKWSFFCGSERASKISPGYFPEGKRITQAYVAAKFPRLATLPFPATDGKDDDSISGAAFGEWLRENYLPDDRQESFIELTKLAITEWCSDLDSFERAVRRNSGEILNWRTLLLSAKENVIKVHVSDPRDPTRFRPVGATVPRSPSLTVWPGCVARVELPLLDRVKASEGCHAWLVADYDNHEVYVLDPTRMEDGRASNTVLRGAVLLPRSHPGHVYLPESTPIGTRFEVVALVSDFGPEPQEIHDLFSALEKKLVAEPTILSTPQHQRNVRNVLDEVVSLLQRHSVWFVVFRQPCEVVRG